jgi:hypothetical protein
MEKNKNTRKRLIAIDFDQCLVNTPEEIQGKKTWEEVKGVPYPHNGWWGRKESLDLDVFDIKPYPNVLSVLRKESSRNDTYVIVLTARMEKLRPYVQAVLDANNIRVDKLDMKSDNKTKGERILAYLAEMPEIKEISVFDDQEKHLDSYREIIDKLPKGVKLNIFKTDEGVINLVESKNKLNHIISDEIENFFDCIYIKKIL